MIINIRILSCLGQAGLITAKLVEKDGEKSGSNQTLSLVRLLDLQSSVFDELWLSARNPQDEQTDETIF